MSSLISTKQAGFRERDLALNDSSCSVNVYKMVYQLGLIIRVNYSIISIIIVYLEKTRRTRKKGRRTGT